MLKRDSRHHPSRYVFEALATLLLALAMLIPAREVGAYAIYTNRADWVAAVGGDFTTDHFNNPIANAASIEFDTGIISTHEDFNHFGGANTFEDANAIFSTTARYQGRAMSDAKEITWVFPSPVFAFGADWISPVSGGLLTVAADFDGTGITTVKFLGPLQRNTDGFFGIVGANPFVSMVFGTESASLDEAFAADNLSFATRIPAPATHALLLAGVAVLWLWRRASRR